MKLKIDKDTKIHAYKATREGEINVVFNQQYIQRGTIRNRKLTFLISKEKLEELGLALLSINEKSPVGRPS